MLFKNLVIRNLQSGLDKLISEASDEDENLSDAEAADQTFSNDDASVDDLGASPQFKIRKEDIARYKEEEEAQGQQTIKAWVEDVDLMLQRLNGTEDSIQQEIKQNGLSNDSIGKLAPSISKQITRCAQELSKLAETLKGIV